jgi:hypothetical protein
VSTNVPEGATDLKLSRNVALQHNRVEIEGNSPAILWQEGYRTNKIFRMNRMIENLYKKSCKSS